jgi:large subunit ribosomal protein L4
MNKKERRLALRTAFFSRTEDFIVVENFAEQISAPKTKEFVGGLIRLGIEARTKTLVILADSIPQNVELSARNIPYVKVIKHNCLNVYDVLNADKILVTSEALTKIQEVYND